MITDNLVHFRTRTALRVATWAAASAFTAFQPAAAGVVAYQHLPESLNASFVSSINGPQLADDFDPRMNLPAGSNYVGRVDWWGSGVAPGASQIFQITFFNGTQPVGSFGRPSAPVGITYTVSPNVEQLGATTLFHYWVELPHVNDLGQSFFMQAGPRPFGREYWISIQSAATGWAWALAGAGPTIGDEHWHAVRTTGAGWNELEGRDFAFELTAVPEPGTWLLLSAGGALIALGRRHATGQ